MNIACRCDRLDVTLEGPCPNNATQEDGLCDVCRVSIYCIGWREVREIKRRAEVEDVGTAVD